MAVSYPVALDDTRKLILDPVDVRPAGAVKVLLEGTMAGDATKLIVEIEAAAEIDGDFKTIAIPGPSNPAWEEAEYRPASNVFPRSVWGDTFDFAFVLIPSASKFARVYARVDDGTGTITSAAMELGKGIS